MANNDISYVRTEDAPLLPPPASQEGIMGWLWENVFRSMSNFSSIGAAIVSILMIILTVFFAYALVSLVYMFLNFVLPPIFDFNFLGFHLHLGTAALTDPQGLERELCNEEGVGMCYPYLAKWFDAHIYGNKYPQDQRWRVDIIYAVLAISVLWLLIEKMPGRKWVGAFMLTLFPILAFVFLNGAPVLDNQSFADFLATGERLIPFAIGAVAAIGWWVGRKGMVGDFGEAFAPVFGTVAIIFLALSLVPIFAGGVDASLGLSVVPTANWGGMLVTLVVALTGIIFSLPIGVLLALGRRSNMPLIKWLCVFFIEVIRGIPLILVLFFASTMLGFFLDPGVTFNKLLRALIGVALFASAYMAEVVRGGLQAVPKGQYEGAMSLGLSYSQMMRLIVLPQALTIVIPGIVNTFIGLFKDTVLVLIISIYDLLGIGQLVALKDLSWAGAKLPYTEYVFLAAIFWVFCFGMSRYSMYMERKLSRGHH